MDRIVLIVSHYKGANEFKAVVHIINSSRKYTGFELCIEHILLFINHNRFKKWVMPFIVFKCCDLLEKRKRDFPQEGEKWGV